MLTYTFEATCDYEHIGKREILIFTGAGLDDAIKQAFVELREEHRDREEAGWNAYGWTLKLVEVRN